MLISCPKCSTAIELDDEARPGRVACRGCGAVLSVEPRKAGTAPCPGCGEPMPTDAAICVHCGYNPRTGKRLETETGIEEPEAPPPALPVRAVMFVGEWMPGLLRPLVLVLSLGLSIFVAACLIPAFAEFTDDFRLSHRYYGTSGRVAWAIRVVGPPVVMALAAAALALVIGVRRFRRWLRWRVPPLREASLSRVASALALMLRAGCPLADALALAREMERGTRAEGPLARLADNLCEGQPLFIGFEAYVKVFPPLFLWLVESSGEALADGFARAAEAYRLRATHRTEMLLYGALPVSVLLLGGMLLSQLAVAVDPLIVLMESIGR